MLLHHLVLIINIITELGNMNIILNSVICHSLFQIFLDWEIASLISILLVRGRNIVEHTCCCFIMM